MPVLESALVTRLLGPSMCSIWSSGRVPLTRLVMVEVKVVGNEDIVETRARKWSGFMCE